MTWKTRTYSRIALFSALIVLVRVYKVPLHVPGLMSVPWITLLLLAHECIGPGQPSSTIVGGITGVILSMLDYPPGPHQALKYVVAGAAIDSISLLASDLRLRMIVGGVSASVSKLAVMYAVAAIYGLPLIVIQVSVAYLAGIHVAFGLLSGFLAVKVLRPLGRSCA